MLTHALISYYYLPFVDLAIIALWLYGRTAVRDTTY
jgi:hypothetical protein